MKLVFLLWLVCLFGLLVANQCHAAEVEPELVCRVQNAIRWKEAAWTPTFCERVAEALNTAGATWKLDPYELLAIATNESDLRPTAHHRYQHPKSGRWGTVDAGLMGVQCHLGPGGVCTNGKVKGVLLATLLSPSQIEVNIDCGARILAAKGSAHRYNGSAVYGERISALVLALHGRWPRSTEHLSVRIIKLINQITGAISASRRS